MSETRPKHSVIVGCLVRNAQDEVLMIRHHRRGWELPQGHVEEGEDLLEALHREVREEAGVEIEIGPLAALWSMVSPSGALIFGFLGRYKDGELAATEDSLEAGWFPESESVEMVTSPVMRDRLTTLLRFDGTPRYRAYSLRPYRLHLERPLLEWSGGGENC